MTAVYTGLLDELHEYGFTTGINDLGPFAVREAGPYRTRIVRASTGWRVINLYWPTSEVPVYEPRATLSAAVECAISTALSVDALNDLATLMTLQVNAELGRAA